ncbi:MAG: hypothetical protein H0X30_22335 [Anaerolineae bacterium]|nr:hypothetical protein [Anaerolineae bacterium]
MFAEDRVLVGVINRKRDLETVLGEKWYRIPQNQMKRGVNAEYIAFFLSKAFGERNGGIHYFADRKGVELLYRRDLLPQEPNHPRANEAYYKIQLGTIYPKVPPVLNTSRRTLSFIYTTWDRFVNASKISDLYSKEDYFVDRIYHALRNVGVSAERSWSAEYRNAPARLRILCENGPLTASTQPEDGSMYLDNHHHEDAILASILAEIAKQGGPVMINVPIDLL